MLWYLLEAPHWAVSNEYPQHVLVEKSENISPIPSLVWSYANSYKIWLEKVQNRTVRFVTSNEPLQSDKILQKQKWELLKQQVDSGI